MPINTEWKRDLDKRDPNLFILAMKGPELNILKIKDNPISFRAWRCQWDAFTTSSGLGKLWTCHPEDAESDQSTERSQKIKQMTEHHLLAALYGCMTMETITIINDMCSLRQGENSSSETIINMIESYITASNRPR